MSTPTVLGSEALTLPADASSNRPVSPTAGMLRYSTDLNQYEAYNTTLSNWYRVPLLNVDVDPAGTAVAMSIALG